MPNPTTAHNPASYEGRHCLLHTLDGTKPAKVQQTVPGRLAYTVAATDGSQTITILASVVWGKFLNDDMPVFYAC